ncbi:hypothetical protein CFAM422_004118 [Trichoderma lentiforme]|uniref:Uncharacterized protein n=1 Tax=Trichoderma lentiforme TaxID=1567552 RepID=A0A9P4XJZ5_9HYPO|nr:hypothetical protein CFAM422_004118 [Trichoderma lentiforme]
MILASKIPIGLLMPKLTNAMELSAYLWMLEFSYRIWMSWFGHYWRFGKKVWHTTMPRSHND